MRSSATPGFPGRRLSVVFCLAFATACNGDKPAKSPDRGDAGPPKLGTPTAEVIVEGAEVPGANGLFFDKNDRLYVASVNGTRLFVVDPDTGKTLETLGADKGVMSPDDVTIAPDGTIYFTNLVHGTVGSISPDGATKEVASVGQGANSVTLSDDGRLFVGLDFLGDGLYELDPTGATMPRKVIAAPGWINAMDFGPDGLIYGPQWTEKRVVRIDPDSGEMTPLLFQFDSLAAAVKFDPKGDLYALEHVPANVVKLDLKSGTRTVLGTYPRAGDNLAFDSRGRLFFSSTEDGAVQELESDGSLRVLKKGGLVAPSGIVVEDQDGVDAVTVMATDLNTYDGATGKELKHRTLGFEYGEQKTKGGGAGMRLDDGKLLLADWTPGHGVEVWEPDTGKVTAKYAADFAMDVIRFRGDIVVSQHFANNVAVVGSDKAVPLASGVMAPTGLAAKDDDLYVASFATGEILRVVDDGEPLTTPEAVATGIERPEGMAFLPSGHLAVVEAGTGNVLAIDLESGEKTVLAEGISREYSVLAGVPAWNLNAIAVGPSGNAYVSSPGDGKLYRISFE
jgi:sugar lactone lactonase YvrE